MGGLHISVVTLFLLLSPLLAYSDTLVETSTNSGPSPCCAVFQKTSSLASKTVFPNSAPYKEQESTYYNSENIDLKPACRISPTTASDVSLIVKLAIKSGCKFAVRSKGHMNWEGASNIGPSGFTIDMQKMNQITLAANKSMVSLGPGSSWGEVYHKLDCTECGISFLSAEHGFASDNVLNYEIVLADGSIVNANLHSHADLYIALKYGSTNYGIVTRFDVTAFPLGKIWGGSLFFNKTDGFALLETLKDFSNQLAKDPERVIGRQLCMEQRFEGLHYLISKFTPFATTMRFTTQEDVTNEVKDLFGSGARARWFTLSLKIDSQIMFDIYTKARLRGGNVQASAGKPGFTTAFTIQPMSKTMVAAGSRNGGNLFGMSTSNGNLLLLLAALFWTDPADDKLFNDTFLKFTVWAQAEATKRGFMTNFIYMNYALGSQDIMSSVGSSNEAKMVKVKNQYDPQNLLGRYWVGGYQLDCN
ncbi:hypothetical protein C8J57DRAFT_1465194 [Mycena rebaudengoi]|nr:hypothetical protein C8J57DRAFT_1465194 [Mycena rebaudengoi]